MIARKCKHIRPMARVRRSVRGGTRSDTTNRHDRPGADCGQGTRPPGYRGEVVSSPTRTSRASASLSVPQPVHSPDPRLTSLAVTTRPFCRANSRGAGHWGSSRLGGSYPFELGPASPAARLEKDHEPTGDWHRVERHWVEETRRCPPHPGWQWQDRAERSRIPPHGSDSPDPARRQPRCSTKSVSLGTRPVQPAAAARPARQQGSAGQRRQRRARAPTALPRRQQQPPGLRSPAPYEAPQDGLCRRSVPPEV